MVTETRISRIIRLSAIETPQRGNMLTFALVPRNTRGVLRRGSFNIMRDPEPGKTESNAIIMLVPWHAPANPFFPATVSNDELESLQPIWSTLYGQQISATPPETQYAVPVQSSEVDFTARRKGVSVLSKGTRSNERAGWSLFVADLESGGSAAVLAMDLEWEMEWIGGSGSKRPQSPIFNEEENQTQGF